MFDLHLPAQFTRALQLNTDQEEKINALLQSTALAVKATDQRVMLSEKAQPETAVLFIPPFADSEERMGEFRQRLAKIMGDTKTEFFISAADPTLNFGLGGSLGKYGRRITVRLNNGKYELTQQLIETDGEGKENERGISTLTFTERLPERFDHLFIQPGQ